MLAIANIHKLPPLLSLRQVVAGLWFEAISPIPFFLVI